MSRGARARQILNKLWEIRSEGTSRMTPKPTGVGGTRSLGWLLGVLLLSAAVAAVLALFVTHGWADIVMVLLVLAALAAAYGVRRKARRRLVYDRDDSAARHG